MLISDSDINIGLLISERYICCKLYLNFTCIVCGILSTLIQCVTDTVYVASTVQPSVDYHSG